MAIEEIQTQGVETKEGLEGKGPERQKVVEQTREALTSVMGSLEKFPGVLMDYADKMRDSKRTGAAAMIVALMMSPISVANASENSNDVLKQATQQGSDYVEQLFENERYDKIRVLAQEFGMDTDSLKDCDSIGDLMQKMKCNTEKDKKESILKRKASEKREQQLAQEEEQLEENIQESKENIEQLAQEEEQLAQEEEQLAEYERILGGQGDRTNTILGYINGKHNNKEAALSAIDYIRSNKQDIRQAIGTQEGIESFEKLLDNLDYLENQIK